jgi:hypothetical protein
MKVRFTFNPNAITVDLSAKLPFPTDLLSSLPPGLIGGPVTHHPAPVGGK